LPSMDMIWRPQMGPQKALINCYLPEVFYGGARGGGKTDGVLGKYALKAKRYGDGFNAVFFRKELPMLDDAIERSQEIFLPLGAEWKGWNKTWRFPWGGRLRFRPLERTADAEKYQGQNISDACVEEAGQYEDHRTIDRLNGVLRSARGVPTQLLLTGNPGGAGQGWIKERYIDPAPAGMELLTRDLPNGAQHRFVFIPSKVQNNRILLKNDPDYINRLYLVGSKELVRAWLEGDWNAVEGAYFDCWSQDIIVRPFEIPGHWTRIRSFDWGSAAPFSVGWWAIAGEDYEGDTGTIPKGAMVRYREWYGAKGANIGLKISNDEIAQGIIDRESGEKRLGAFGAVHDAVADPSIQSRSGAPSILEQLYSAGVQFRPVQRTNTTGSWRVNGWNQMRDRMIGDDRPMIYCFDTCADSIRTIPALQHDDVKAEDLDTDGEDHAADEWRYACMSRPYTRVKKVEKDFKIQTRGATWNELMKDQRRKRQLAAE
jgi:hypothetical protein